MKNIEKYTNTKDALAAYNALVLKNVPFNEWLECEYEEPCKLTLLDAVNELKGLWDKSTLGCHSITFETWNTVINRLSDAAERERCKPVLNYDKYKTAEEALFAYRQISKDNHCSKCTYAGCCFNWIYSEAGKEEAK